MPEGEMGFVPPGEIGTEGADNESLATGVASEISEVIAGDGSNQEADMPADGVEDDKSEAAILGSVPGKIKKKKTNKK